MVEPSIILNHALVPEHKVITKKATKELIDGMRIKREQLPKIRESDPVIKAINGKKGDVVEITRDSITAGKAVYYRLVI